MVRLAEIRPSLPARALAALGLWLPAATLVALALGPETPPAQMAALLLPAAVLVLLAARMWTATRRALILTADALQDDTGRVLVRIEDVVALRRGPFALKPAGGFRLTLRAPAARAWAPGLWWRLGRSLGVGGAVNRREARYMAEALEHLIAARG